MLTNIDKKIFGSRNDRLLKQYRKSVAKINALEKQMQALSDAELQAKTAEFLNPKLKILKIQKSKTLNHKHPQS